MQCDVDLDMELTATTQASWYGAPGPLFCGPKVSAVRLFGRAASTFGRQGSQCNASLVQIPVSGVSAVRLFGRAAPTVGRQRSQCKTCFCTTCRYWDYSYTCDYSWKDPPEYCSDYPGQKGGRYVNEGDEGGIAGGVPNASGRTDVEGCCWWGRG